MTVFDLFPLHPGTTFHYEGETDGIPTSDDMFVTHETKLIAGVRCTVVHDLVYTASVLSEGTLDWYAQDFDGNVTSTEGSWQAGVNGARQVINLNRSACVAYGCFDDLLLTKEFSPLEKGVTEHKSYASGVGNILIDVVKGGDEHSELVRVSTAN